MLQQFVYLYELTLDCKNDQNLRWWFGIYSERHAHSDNGKGNSASDREHQGGGSEPVDADSEQHQQLVATALEDNRASPSVQLAKGWISVYPIL